MAGAFVFVRADAGADVLDVEDLLARVTFDVDDFADVAFPETTSDCPPKISSRLRPFNFINAAGVV